MIRNRVVSISFIFAAVASANLVACKSRSFNTGSQVKSDFSTKPNCAAAGQATCVASCQTCRTQYFCVSSKAQCNAEALEMQGGMIYRTPMDFSVEGFEGSNSGGGSGKGKYPAFNAFTIWQNGNGTETYDYPQGYDDQTGRQTPDGVFFVARSEYYSRTTFVGVPTEGIRVVDNVLEYPAKNGKQLKLKFTEVSGNMDHGKAVTHCRGKGLRLPTMRELFDFCAAGVTEPNYGSKFTGGAYPKSPNARCAGTILWTASVESDYGEYAWKFGGNYGDASSGNYRTEPADVRCVGGEASGTLYR